MSDIMYTGDGIIEQTKEDFKYTNVFTLDDIIKYAKEAKTPLRRRYYYVTQWFLDAWKKLTGKDFIEEYNKMQKQLYGHE